MLNPKPKFRLVFVYLSHIQQTEKIRMKKIENNNIFIVGHLKLKFKVEKAICNEKIRRVILTF